MIIDVKATKAKGDERSPSPYAFTEEKPSRGARRLEPAADRDGPLPEIGVSRLGAAGEPFTAGTGAGGAEVGPKARPDSERQHSRTSPSILSLSAAHQALRPAVSRGPADDWSISSRRRPSW